MRQVYRYIFLIELLIILFSGVLIIFDHQGLALKVLIASFWLQAIGTVMYIIMLKNES